MVGTKNFNPSEFKCKCCNTNNTQQRLVDTLQRVRDRIGVPIRINSAYRCPEHNAAIGGKPNSAHTKGLAVDIDCQGDKYRYALVTALLKLGFERIGIYKTFIHADLDLTLPNEIISVK